MNFEDLMNPELQEKLKGARTPEELLAIAKDEGFELSGEELNGISGGVHWCTDRAYSDRSFCLPRA